MDMEAWLTQGNNCVNILIQDDGIVHHFDINNGKVRYELLRQAGEPVAISSAELQSIEEDEYGYVMRVLVKSLTHIFEIITIRGKGRWIAYKSLRR